MYNGGLHCVVERMLLSLVVQYLGWGRALCEFCYRPRYGVISMARMRHEQMRIIPGDFNDSRVIALLRQHLEGMHANSPPESVFALDLTGLRAAGVSFFTAWEGETLLGMGALKELDPTTGEIKSMRTDPAHLRRGVGAEVLEHLIAIAWERGYRRLSLETGSGPAFEPALALYRRRGFVDGEPFGDYAKNAFNQFLHLDL